MSTTHALIAASAGAALEPGTIERRALRDDDVQIDVKFAGICHSDIHQVREEWGQAIFPMVVVFPLPFTPVTRITVGCSVSGIVSPSTRAVSASSSRSRRDRSSPPWRSPL